MGWIKKSRDTGWRDITSSLMNGWTADYVHARRVRDRVMLRVLNLDGSARTSLNFLQLPNGFVIPRTRVPVVLGTMVQSCQVNNSGVVAAASADSTQDGYAAQCSGWDVPGVAFPSTYPGEEVA